jgi:D-3-phosphoglycerate dehydrogenase
MDDRRHRDRRHEAGFGILINASRGTVVEIDALAGALKEKKLLGAAIDVFPVEPRSNKDEFLSPLRGLDNVILTPHIGGSTMEAQANIGLEVAEKLVKYSDNGTSTSSVNFPEVALPAHPGKHRLLHIHRNVPGVLSEINKIFSDNNINISSQFLQTNEKIGYVVMDIDAASSDLALEKLAKVNGTRSAAACCSDAVSLSTGLRGFPALLTTGGVSQNSLRSNSCEP